MSFPDYQRILPEIALTFDDVLLEPAASSVMPADASLATRFSQNITLNIPLVSSAMDTVTEFQMALAMAQLGGIGVLHRNLNAGKQADMVRQIKSFQTRIIKKPITVTPETAIAEVIDLQKRYGISGIAVVDGTSRTLAGLITARDIQSITDTNQPVSAYMKKEKLITVTSDTPLEEAYSLMDENKIERVLVVDKKNQLTGIITKKDQ